MAGKALAQRSVAASVVRTPSADLAPRTDRTVADPAVRGPGSPYQAVGESGAANAVDGVHVREVVDEGAPSCYANGMRISLCRVSVLIVTSWACACTDGSDGAGQNTSATQGENSSAGDGSATGGGTGGGDGDGDSAGDDDSAGDGDGDGDGDGAGDGESTGGDEATGGGESTGASTGDDGNTLGSSTVRGRVSDADGVGVAALTVTLCGEVCLIASTDPDGYFEFEGVDAGMKVIEPAVVPAGEDFTLAVRSWTRFFDFIAVGDAEDVVVERPYVLHRVEDAVGPLTGAQSLDLSPNLSVSFNADTILEDGPLPAGADGVWLGATPIAEEDWPTQGLEGWTVLVVWGLAIWDLEAPDVFSVQARLPVPLDPGADVAFLVADYTYGFTEGHYLEEAAELAEDGATISTPTDGGLDRSTRWLAVTRTP